MPILPRKNKEEISQSKDLSEIRDAVHQPFKEIDKGSRNNLSRDMPPGLENAPSPTPNQESEQVKKINDENIPPNNFMQKQPTTKKEMSPLPLQQQEQPSERASFEVIEEIAESVISEKWEDLIKGVGDLKLWKEKVDTDMAGIKQEILRVQTRFENLQNSIFGKVSEYGEGITEIGTEIKALEMVLQKIISPLSRNIKDLQKVTDILKK